MGKKGTQGHVTAREPPVPTDSHAEIEDWMIRLVMPEMHPSWSGWTDRSARRSRGSSTPSSGSRRTTGCRTSADHRDRRLHRLRERLVGRGAS